MRATRKFLIVMFVSAFCSCFAGQVFVPLKAAWKFKKGTAEASSPNTLWRGLNFDDSTWSSGNAPFYYGENVGPGTLLPDMQNGYTTVFLRTKFVLTNAPDIDRMALRTLIDDGFVAWVNGTEIARFNVSGAKPYNGLADATIEQTWVTNSIASPSNYLVNGTNLLAVQLLNATPGSSDIVLDLQLESTSDKVPPVIAAVNPPPGQVGALSSITVRFSEPVQGVSASDLLVNNQPTLSLNGSGDTYTFFFDPPAFGVVDISWEAGHFIEDLADPPNPFDSTAAGATWQYTFSDDIPPSVVTLTPPAGAAVRALTQVELKASEPLAGVDPGDLLINGIAATNLLLRNGNVYVFEFAQPPPGTVTISWSAGHGITDQANPPNPFSPAGWSYILNPNLPVASVVISEFLAAAENPGGLKDEDGELQDWIELYNRSSSSVNLAGWSLTDDPEDPDLWIFPDITLAPDARLVVFASAKDRRSTAPGAYLHTNFKLNADGEYLGLFNADSPRVAMTEFRDGYPPQRNDYSYALDSGDAWNYFQTPSPGQPNGATTILGALSKPEINVKRGTYDAPFDLVITNEIVDAVIRYTLDGSQPTSSTGQLYSGPVRISKTTTLRAAAFKNNYIPSETITDTYIFTDQVLHQPNNPAGFPVGPTVMAGYPSDYEMDPEIVNDPAYSGQMKDALLALPILSVVLKVDDMFGGANGIYTHSTSRGPLWERPCSIEFIPRDGKDFQVNAGIQVQGNAAREPQKSPKHPFRVVFKGDYGPGKLNYRIFPDSPVESFDTLVLRADYNNSWIHWDPTQRHQGQRTRDSWMKDSMRAMGGLASHNRYFHLYINGLYWGIYDFSERPDASMGAAYYGGKKEDYDVINEGAVVDGNANAYNTLLGFTNLGDINQYTAIKQYLDMTQFIDYMLLHFYVGHEDWGLNKNWYTIRPKDGSSGFKYVPWDGENILDDPNNNRVSNTDVPSGLHTKLLASSQYRLDFADRVQKHFFNGGALTPEETASRWMKRARQVELPIIAESARWGDYRRDVHQFSSPPYELYTRDNQWREEQNRLMTVYFPNRTANVLDQLEAAGLFPTVVAPSFNQQGGKINPGFSLVITAPAGSIYYTTNGVDPRVYGTAAVSSDAKTYAGPLILNATAVIKARAFSGGTWSALNEARFTTDGLRFPLRITEIMYNPEPPGDAYEFIELKNFSALPLDVSGYYLTGVDFVFSPQTILAPGQIIVLGSSQNLTSFAQRYPGVQVFRTFNGQLLNRGERLALLRADGQVIVSVDYDDEKGWPKAADGAGSSLEIIDPYGDPDDPANWHASANLGGSPGQVNSDASVPPVLINEVSAASELDWVELLNDSSTQIDMSGWTLHQAGNANDFVFPAATRLQAGEFLVVYCDKLTNAAGFHAPFRLDQDGETLILSDASANSVNVLTFGPQAVGFTVARVSGKLELCDPTPGAANVEAGLGSPANLVINEWLADSPPGGSDWIELHNTSTDKPVSLRGLFWGVTNQLFEITSAAFIGPGGYVLLKADGEPGPDHVDFKLPAEGGTISLFTSEGTIIDQIDYGVQTESVSEGRYPDGTPNIIQFPLSPTPRAANSLSFPVSVVSEGADLTLEWPTVNGRKYQVEFANDLPVQTWSFLAEMTATNSIISVRDPLQSSRRYYRVLALP